MSTLVLTRRYILPLIALSMASSGDIRREKFIKKELKALKRICKIATEKNL